jgi:hypothetical protein
MCLVAYVTRTDRVDQNRYTLQEFVRAGAGDDDGDDGQHGQADQRGAHGVVLFFNYDLPVPKIGPD